MTVPAATTSASPMPDELSEIQDPAGWRGSDLGDIGNLSLALDPPQLDELETALERVEDAGVPLEATDEAHFHLPTLGPILDGIRQELEDGKGFVLLRGLPFDRWSTQRSRLAAWAIGCWLGRHVCQNAQGQRIVDVTDLTAEGQSPRQYRTSQELRLHNDPASDIIGLGCLRAAKSGGESVITSAVAIHNAMLKERPDLLALLYQGFHWHRFGEGRPEDGAVTAQPVPLFATQDGRLSCRYVRAPIAAGHKTADLPLSDAQVEALDLFDRLAASPELRLSFRMQPGDLLLVNNLVVLHARTQFLDHPEAERKRHMVRLWIEGRPGFRSVPPTLNFFNGGACGIPQQEGRIAAYSDLDSLYRGRESGGVARLGISSTR